mgnify:CR=1 FL=1
MADDASFDGGSDVLTATAQGRLRTIIERLERLEELQDELGQALHIVRLDVRNRAVRAGCTDTGGRNLAFEERNQFCNRRMMGVRDQGLGAGVRNRPDRGD